MIKQIFAVLFAVLAVSSAVVREFPPGVNPALCPNYPYCNNELVALHSPVPYTAPGYPANINPAACPNYPYCNVGHPAVYPAY